MAARWTEAEDEILIRFYRDHPSLWRPKHGNYYKRDQGSKHLCELRAIFSTINFNVSVAEIKKRFKNLRVTYGRERKKVDDSKKSGPGAIHVSKWMYFERMDFLCDSLKADESVDTMSPAAHQGNNKELEEGKDDSGTGDSMDLRAIPIHSPDDCRQSPEPACGSQSVDLDTEKKAFLSAATNALIRGATASVDSETAFGSHIACSLKQLSGAARETAKLEIQTILHKHLMSTWSSESN